ncbi:helix-turn-helix domain-containing protein [Streptomyces mirabilis]|uniref:helix-turn-helix domain-containing protein n=1 Tax=Streptomyces mirabilis TaxID=68239 RepID=UPI00369598AC
MAEKKAGRGWGDLQADTVEGRALAIYLRQLLDRSGKQLRDLEPSVRYGRSTISEFFSGKKVPSQQFIVKAVDALTTPLEREIRRQEALALWHKAKNPAPPSAHLPAPRPAEEAAAAALASVAATAQDQAAHAQEQLTQAHERNDRLTQERNRAQQMVTALSMLTVDLQQRMSGLKNHQGQETQQELARLTYQLDTAQQDLGRARASREEAEQLTRRLRRRSDELEEQLARLRATAPAPRSEPTLLPPMPEDLQEAFFRADFDQMLDTVHGFLDEGQALRDEVRDEWDLTPPRRTATQIIQRWQTATHLLGRALGCLLLMTTAVALLAVTDAGAPGWAPLLVLLAVSGLVLTADPWEPARRLWPVLRSSLRGEPLARQIRFSAKSLSDRLVRCLTALAGAATAAFSLFTATRWSSWWLLALLPAAAALAAYTVVGKDRRVLPMLQDAIGSLAADLKAPRRQQPDAAPRPRLVLTDRDWLDARRQEVADAMTGPWRQTPLWIKTAVVIPAFLVLMSATGALLSALSSHVAKSWDGSGLTATVDRPVRAYLHAHTAGLPVTATTLHLVWVASGAGLLAFSFLTGAFGARLTWILWGAATTVMVWSGTAGPARQVAAGLAVIGWGISSIAGLRGLVLRPELSHNVTVNNNSD